jgi:hypothetical protein
VVMTMTTHDCSPPSQTRYARHKNVSHREKRI